MLQATFLHYPRPRKRFLAVFLCPIVLLAAGVATTLDKINR